MDRQAHVVEAPRIHRQVAPVVRCVAVRRYDAPRTITLVPLTDADRSALIADFQDSFEHFRGNPQGSFVEERLPRASNLRLVPARATQPRSRSCRCPTLMSP